MENGCVQITNVNHILFRAHRYAPQYPGLTGRDLDGHEYRELNERYGLA